MQNTLEWADKQEINIIPISFRSKKPKIKEWKSYQTRMSTAEEREKWFGDGFSNVAVIAGGVSNNLIIFDVDDHHLGAELVHKLPSTHINKSSKGYHFYYRINETRKKDRLEFLNKEKKIVGVDIQGEGSYVLCPPSIHPSGVKYECFRDNEIPLIEYEEIVELISGTAHNIGLTLKPRKNKIAKKLRKRKQDSTQELIDLLSDLEDLVGFDGLGSHPIHGSDTGTNLDVDSKGDQWFCFRHQVGGSRLQYYALLNGIIECEEATSMTTEQYRQTFEAIKKEYNWQPPKQILSVEQKEVTPDLEKEILRILKDPELIKYLQKEFNKIGVVKESQNRLIIFYSFISALLLPEPVNVIFEGASSSGKSWVLKANRVNFPKGFKNQSFKGKDDKKTMQTEWLNGFGYVPLNDMTLASLYRIGLENPYFFNKKMIVWEEFPQKPSEEQVRVQQIIRILISEGEVNKNLTIDGRSLVIYLKGHPGFITCDASMEVEEQLLNRTLMLNPDESSTQSKAITEKQGLYAEKPWLSQTVMKASRILSNIYPFLKSYQVINPWGRNVSNLMCEISGDPQIRRTNKLVLRYIDLRVLLFQHQRDIVFHNDFPDKHYLLATREDVLETLILLESTIRQTITRVMASAIACLDDIKDETNEVFWKIKPQSIIEQWIPRKFTYKDFANFKKQTYKTAYRNLKSLVDADLLILDDKTRPHKLKLNLDTKSEEEFSGILRENLQSAIIPKELPADLSRLLSQPSQRVMRAPSEKNDDPPLGKSGKTSIATQTGEI